MPSPAPIPPLSVGVLAPPVEEIVSAVQVSAALVDAVAHLGSRYVTAAVVRVALSALDLAAAHVGGYVTAAVVRPAFSALHVAAAVVGLVVRPADPVVPDVDNPG